ncbi:hypothetical protein BDW22DRAFT_1414114 [Trametopsis cervina]|nr:hypothetical protein BDW22DRAFT_1414114 [Trametopsis cervina]
MFKFDFEIDEDPEVQELLETQKNTNENVSASEPASQGDIAGSSTAASFQEHPLDALLKTLPGTISFSPLHISTPKGGSLTLPRRDLFDARFQLISNSSLEERNEEQVPEVDELQFVEAPSDLIPGVYEGGLKTWECSLDLAGYLGDYLDSQATRSTILGKRILELGSGTAIPSMRLIHEAFSQPPNSDRRTAIHMQDYNELVFRLAVLPNIILTWYMSPASATFRESNPHRESTDEDEDTLPPVDPTQSGDLPLTPALITAFRQSLDGYNIEIRFFSGSWETFDLSTAGGKYDVVLTSETIYRIESLPPLLDLMWRACTQRTKSLEELTSDMTMSSKEANSDPEHLCIVAAKLVYFGVGGGVTEFIDAVQGANSSSCGRRPGTVESVWKKDEGVKRVILKVHWK